MSGTGARYSSDLTKQPQDKPLSHRGGSSIIDAAQPRKSVIGIEMLERRQNNMSMEEMIFLNEPQTNFFKGDDNVVSFDYQRHFQDVSSIGEELDTQNGKAGQSDQELAEKNQQDAPKRNERYRDEHLSIQEEEEPTHHQDEDDSRRRPEQLQVPQSKQLFQVLNENRRDSVIRSSNRIPLKGAQAYQDIPKLPLHRKLPGDKQKNHAKDSDRKPRPTKKLKKDKLLRHKQIYVMEFPSNTANSLIVLPNERAQGFRLNCYDPNVLNGVVSEAT